jgi:alpha-beta hydrolase superfamily lysophospholipase
VETSPAAHAEHQKVVTSLPVDHSGTTVYVKGWKLPASDKPPLLIVHDLGEHTGLYRETALSLIDRGYSVYAFDLRGHGRSGRRLGHAPSFNVLVSDLLQVAAWVRHLEGGRSPIIMGHGVGALIVMDFTKRHGSFCKAAILSAPCMELQATLSLPARFLIRFIAEVAPTFRIPARLSPRFAKDLKHVHQDADEQARSIYFPRLTAIFTQELLLAIRRARASFIEYDGQVLILVPGDDGICSYATLKKSAALHAQHNLKISDLPGVGHNVFTEGQAARESALGVLVRWLDDVFKGPQETEPPRKGATALVADPEDDGIKDSLPLA